MRTCLLFLFLLPAVLSPAQDTIPQRIEFLLELLSEQNGNEEEDYSSLIQLLTGYQTEPLDLNYATDEELEDLQLINSLQIQMLRAHIAKHGRLLSVYELQSIDGWDEMTIHALLPFITTGENINRPSYTPRAVLYDGKHEFILRGSRVLEKQKGFSPVDSLDLAGSLNSRYAGDPYKLYARYRFTFSNRVSAGITGEKDPGEVFLPGYGPDYAFYRDSLKHFSHRGFDFYSAHFFFRTSGWLRALAAGDFQAGFGQGLVAWSGMAYGKNPDGISVRRNAAGLKPHTGTDENLFLRGAGVTLGHGPLELTTFISSKKVDANIVADTSMSADNFSFSSLQTSGYHSTLSELSDRKVLRQTVFGGNLRYSGKKLKTGITGVSTSYDLPSGRELALYNQYTFNGSQTWSAGADYSWVHRNMNFFGEMATNESGGFAMVHGMLAVADPRFSFSAVYRHYSRGYHSVFSNPVSESSTAANESGVYLGVNIRLRKDLSLSGYYDQFRFPWLKYQVSAPSAGYEITAQFSWQPIKKTELYIRFRHRETEKDESSGTLDAPERHQQENIRMNLVHMLSRSLSIKTRIEFIRLLSASRALSENGFVIAQDVLWKPIGSRWSVAARYALFDTDSYDTRVYIYENDLPGSFSIPALYGNGSRTYLNISCDLSRYIEILGRFSQTWYSDREIISEGSLTQISGNTKSEARLMLRVKW
ncbi:MAG: hypothetical protein IT233_00865 [Bacteroidia bacterium]|nr:hypothetical protein [Bacteroidia bacterium]